MALSIAPRWLRLTAARDNLVASALRLEARLGMFPTALLVATACLVLAAVYITPALKLENFGFEYAQLSLHPFDFAGQHHAQRRILTPLIGYILFLRGVQFIFVPLLMAVLFLASVYAHFRRVIPEGPLAALCACVAIALSTTTLFTLHFAGYTDTTSYLLIWICLISRRRLVQWLTFALALLNHEHCAFAFPFLVLRPQENESLRAVAGRAALLVTAFGPFAGYRYFLDLKGTSDVLSPSVYLSLVSSLGQWVRISRHLPVAAFESFRLLWFLPIAATLQLWETGKRRSALWIALVVLCAGSQAAFAGDLSRYFGLAFPAILYGLETLTKERGPSWVAERCVPLLLLNLLVPFYYVDRDWMYPFFPLPFSLLLTQFDLNPWEFYWR